MKLSDRIKNYEAIEKYRGRPLIVYATSTRQGVPAVMAGDAVREFIDQINAIQKGDGVDVLIHSTGGDALAAWKLMSALRERFSQVAVLVPLVAFSAATIFALGADEIVMHPHASLGPIDPQITANMPDGKIRSFSYEDFGAFLRFLAEEVKITEQVHLSTIIERLFSTVDPLTVGTAKRASELSASVGERLLLTHMGSAEDKARARQIAENLNKSFFAHGDAVSRTRAKKLQLKINKPDEKLESLMWDAYLGLESYLSLREPFNPLHHYLTNDKAAQSLKPIAPVVLPPNTSQQLAQQIWQQVAQQALNNFGQPLIEVEYTIVGALIESVRFASEFRTEGSLVAFRTPNTEIKITATDKKSGWQLVDINGG